MTEQPQQQAANGREEPLAIEITAHDAFWLMRYYEQPGFHVHPEFILGRENHLRLEAHVGPVTLVGQVWTDGQPPTWRIELR